MPRRLGRLRKSRLQDLQLLRLYRGPRPPSLGAPIPVVRGLILCLGVSSLRVPIQRTLRSVEKQLNATMWTDPVVVQVGWSKCWKCTRKVIYTQFEGKACEQYRYSRNIICSPKKKPIMSNWLRIYFIKSLLLYLLEILLQFTNSIIIHHKKLRHRN